MLVFDYAWKINIQRTIFTKPLFNFCLDFPNDPCKNLTLIFYK